jgi:hypothetical protein
MEHLAGRDPVSAQGYNDGIEAWLFVGVGCVIVVRFYLPKVNYIGSACLYSVLHISDLHRSKSEPLDNDSLMGALSADLPRYMAGIPAVPKPRAIIISGDLIQGAPPSDPDFRETIRVQYSDAYDLLCRLADTFLGGDRSQIVLVPGNHDICWNTSALSMEQIDISSHPPDLLYSLNSHGSEYRWSWKQKTLHRIANKNMYAQRLDAYWDTACKFYADADLVLPIDRSRGFNLFELFGKESIVAAFESTENNDCYSFVGEISSASIARCNKQILELGLERKFKIAVWHHSIQGPPRKTDYMDIESVYAMIGYGFKLGFHGHQHISSVSSYYVHVPEREKMAVISAGSVCAGTGDLPRGANRQYNVITLEKNFSNVNVQVREMTNGGHFTRKQSGEFVLGHVTLELSKSTSTLSNPLSKQDQPHIFAAEVALKSGDMTKASSELKKVADKSNAYYRELQYQVHQALDDWEKIIETFNRPLSAKEVVLLIEALLRTHDHLGAESTLAAFRDLIDDPNTETELSNRISTFKLLRQK